MIREVSIALLNFSGGHFTVHNSPLRDGVKLLELFNLSLRRAVYLSGVVLWFFQLRALQTKPKQLIITQRFCDH